MKICKACKVLNNNLLASVRDAINETLEIRSQEIMMESLEGVAQNSSSNNTERDVILKECTNTDNCIQKKIICTQDVYCPSQAEKK